MEMGTWASIVLKRFSIIFFFQNNVMREVAALEN
jgi:hypothetical protein